MSAVEAVLTYRPVGTDSSSSTPIPIGSSDDPRVLRALRDRLIENAAREVSMWSNIDPGVAAMRQAELDRLYRIFTVLLPDEDLQPDLYLIGLDEGNAGKKKGPHL